MVKRYYDTSVNWLFKEGVLYVILFVVGIVAGSLYAVTLKGDQSLFFIVKQYITFDDVVSQGGERLVGCLKVYGRNIFLLWLGGLSSFTLPLSGIVFFLCMFSYGFTISCFLLLYGVKGIFASLLIFGVQAGIFVFIAIYLGNQGMRYALLDKGMKMQSYVQKLAIGGIAIVLVSLVDVYVQPTMERIMFYWIK